MMQAMIFAAGMGTRLKPLTDTMPKALVRVDGKPLLRHVIEGLQLAGAERIVVNVHHFADQIDDYLRHHDNFGMDIRLSDERQQLFETGGGIKHARTFFDPASPILIHNVDILSNINLKAFYEQATADATLLVSERRTKRYLVFNDEMRLIGWTNIETREVKSPFDEIRQMPYDELVSQYQLYAFSGIHVFSPTLFPLTDEWPDRFPIIDFYLAACAKANIRGYLKKDLRLLDVGKLDTLAEAEEFLKVEKGLLKDEKEESREMSRPSHSANGNNQHSHTLSQLPTPRSSK